MGFLLLPIYTNYFSKAEIGFLSTYESLGRMIVFLISLYLDAAFIRFFYKEKADKHQNIPLFFSTHFWFVVVWGGIAAFVITLSVTKIVPGLPPASMYLMPALVYSQLLTQLVSMVTSIWGAELLARRVAIFQIVFSILSLIITMYLITLERVGWESRIYALFFASVIQLITVLYFLINSGWLILGFNWSTIHKSLKYSIPLIPNVAAGWIAMFSDRLVMSYYGLLDQVGVYSIAAQIAMVLYIINDAITRVQGALAMSGLTADPKIAKQEMSKFIHIYFSLMIFFYVMIVFVLPTFVIYVLGEEYMASIHIFIILGWIYIISGLYRVFTNIISYHGATWVISLGAIVQAIFNMAINFIFIPIYGMYAAAISSLLSVLLYSAWIFIWSQKMDKINIEYAKLTIVFIAAILATFLISMFDLFESNALGVMCKVITLVCLIVVIYNFQRVEVKEYILQKVSIKKIKL